MTASAASTDLSPRRTVFESPAWRRVRRSAVGSRTLDSRLGRRAVLARQYLRTARACRRSPAAFSSTGTLLVFLGHVKSGGSLIGAMLDAHPDAAIADEVDVLRYVRSGFRRDQILHLLVASARREARGGRITARRLQPYSLAVPGQWQGRVRTPLVVGDSRAGPTTRRAGDDPASLHQLDVLMAGIDVRFVHVVRNPFDPISAMVERGRRSHEDAIADYFEQCRRLELLRARVEPQRLLTVRYESFVSTPRRELANVCAHIGLPLDDEHLAACAAIADSERLPERRRVPWRAEHIDMVEGRSRAVDFLDGYGYGA